LQGRFREAIADYDVLVREKPDHVAWYNRQIALWTHHHLDTPVTQFNIDRYLLSKPLSARASHLAKMWRTS
jgi:hypothetical protein